MFLLLFMSSFCSFAQMILRYNSDVERCLNKVENRKQRMFDFDTGRQDNLPSRVRSEPSFGRSMTESMMGSNCSSREENKRVRYEMIHSLLQG